MNVSDKVVCVDDSPGKVTGRKLLQKGQVYVVEGVDPLLRLDGHGLFLVGVPNWQTPLGTVLGWSPTRFRLLADLKAEAAAAAAAAQEQLSMTTTPTK